MILWIKSTINSALSTSTTDVTLLQAFQIANARQGDVEDKNLDVFLRMVARSDPEMHNYLDLTVKPTVADEDHYPQEVLDLCRDDSEWETEPETEE